MFSRIRSVASSTSKAVHPQRLRRTYATGEKYIVPKQAFDDFHTKGYAVLPNFLTEEVSNIDYGYYTY